MVSCKIACEDVNDHSIDHSTIFTKTSPDSINPHPGGSPSDFKFSDTKVISHLIVLRSPQCKNLGMRLTGMIEWRQMSKPPKSPGDGGGGGGGSKGMLCLSWVSESFRHDIGQFHSPQMKPCISANYFIPQFHLGKFIVIVIVTKIFFSFFFPIQL